MPNSDLLKFSVEEGLIPSSRISIDVTEYVSVLRSGDEESIKRLKHEFELEMVANGTYNFREAIKPLMPNHDIPIELERSPAYQVTSRIFGELLSNAVDAFVEKANRFYLDHGVEINPMITTLDCILKDNIDASLVTITLADNGVGFRPDILGKIETKQARINSDCLNSGALSTKQQDALFESHKRMSFGGGGKALKMLINSMDNDAARVLRFSNMRAANNTVLGALITICTPRLPAEISMHEAMEAPSVQLPLNIIQRNKLFKASHVSQKQSDSEMGSLSMHQS